MEMGLVLEKVLILNRNNKIERLITAVACQK